MTPEQEQALIQKVNDLQARLDRFERQDRFYLYKDVQVLKEQGVRIGTDTKQKLGFWGRAPTIQFNSTGESVGHDGHGGAALTHTDDFYGGLEFSTGNRYTINDIVKALKRCGILAV